MRTLWPPECTQTVTSDGDAPWAAADIFHVYQQKASKISQYFLKYIYKMFIKYK